MSVTYRMKRPITVEVIHYIDRDSRFEILTWGTKKRPIDWDGESLSITTMEGVMEAWPGDWIIKGVEGECYPCHPRIFEKTYELVPDA